MSMESDSLRDLAADYYLRELTPAELAALQAGLKTDPELRDVFMQAASEDWLMHHMHHAAIGKIIPMRPRRTQKLHIQRIAAGVAVLLTLGGLLVAQKTFRPSEGATVAMVTECFVLPDDAISAVKQGRVRLVGPDAALHSGDRVMLPPGSRLTFRYLNENTSVHMSGGSFFALTNRDGAKEIHLKMGRMSADVDKQAPGKPMRIFTDDAEAVVLGTSFELLAADITRLAVRSGCVRFISPDANQNIEVPSGFLAESDENEDWKSLPFFVETLTPYDDKTIGNQKEKSFISVDFKRKYFGYLKFELGAMKAPLIEAKLRLRVMNKGSDTGGSGTIRLYSLPTDVSPDDPAASPRMQISQYVGKVGAGMDLEFDINPAKLTEGINTLMIAQDEGGNDFWFSSSKGAVAPQLLLKLETPPVE